MADVELLPLPAPDYLLPLGPDHDDISMWSENTIRQIVAHATAAKDAEIEALRAEVDEWKDMARCASEQQDALFREARALNERAERLAEEVEALRAKTAVTMGVGTGDGKLFVHGDYESIKAAQEIVLERDALRAEVERLTFEMSCLRQQYDERTACMIVHRGSALACSDAVRAAYSEEHERAERLAEALRLALDSHGVMLMTDPTQDAWKVRRVEEIGRALLREQEEGNGQ